MTQLYKLMLAVHILLKIKTMILSQMFLDSPSAYYTPKSQGQLQYLTLSTLPARNTYYTLSTTKTEPIRRILMDNLNMHTVTRVTC